eukprot:COSAG02_NODE_2791_length_8022_cov_5.437208_10_plen_42_part_00
MSCLKCVELSLLYQNCPIRSNWRAHTSLVSRTITLAQQKQH